MVRPIKTDHPCQKKPVIVTAMLKTNTKINATFSKNIMQILLQLARRLGGRLV